jgi:phage-related protein
MPWDVYYFQTARGNYPVKDFIDSQDEILAAKIVNHIGFLREKGPFLKPPLAKKILTNIYELRLTGRQSTRILYSIINGKYYLLHAFIKKSQKIPPRELKTAIARLRELI